MTASRSCATHVTIAPSGTEAATLPRANSAAADTVNGMRQLTVVQLNDLHGYLTPHPELFDLPAPRDLRSGGGIARIAAAVRHIRAERPAVFLDNGDTFHGTMAAVHTQGTAMCEAMNALGIDAATLHWEFAYGLAGVKALADTLEYPILAANFHDESGTVTLPPFVAIDCAGVRVGVIGLAAAVARQLLPAPERDQVRLTIGEDELRALVPRLRREHGANLIVVLSHLGFPQDCKLAARVPGVDVILSGHTHDRLRTPALIDNTLIMQSGAHGSFLGRLDVDVAADGIAGWRHELVQIDDGWQPAPDVENLVGRGVAPFKTAQNTILGETTTPLDRYGMLESTMDNLLVDAVANAAGTNVALSNGWRYGAPLAPGRLTEWDIWSIVPANPPVSTVTLTGQELRGLFEENLEAVFACDPWEQRGGYVKRFRGFRLLAKLENPKGHRIHELAIDGRPVAHDDRIVVAFLGEQAVPKGLGRDRCSIAMRAADALRHYLLATPSVAPRLDQRMTLI